MQIQYYGDSCFKISVKPGGRATEDIVLFFDPHNGKSGLRAVYGNANIILISDQNQQIDTALFKGKPIVFQIPGEYSAFGVNIIGSGFEAQEKGSTEKQKTIYLVEVEDMKLAFLGKNNQDLSEKQVELVGDANILFLPIGGGSVLTPKSAAEIARNIEPHIIIPMCYSMLNLQEEYEDVQKLYNELGTERKDILQKFTVKQKDLEPKNMEIVELEPQR